MVHELKKYYQEESVEKLQNKKRPANARRYNNPGDISMFQIAMIKYDQARVNVLVRSSFLSHLKTKEAITCALLHCALNSIEQQMGRKILTEWNGHEIKIDLDALLRERQAGKEE